MRIYSIATIFLLLLASITFAQPKTVFSGNPKVRISERGINRIADTLDFKEAMGLRCVVSQIGDKYYWAIRENIELVRMESGIFVTFVAVNGAGYIRIIRKDGKPPEYISKYNLPSMGKTEATFDYVEHVLLGLGSITYYGNLEQSDY